MAHLHKVSTDAAKTPDRLKQWQEFNSMVVGRPMKAFGNESFQGELEYATVADVSWCKISASGHRVEIEDVAEYGRQSGIHVIFQLKGESYRKQGNRGVLTSAGEWTIRDLRKPYVSSSSDDIELLVLRMPFNSISTKLCDISAFTLRRFSGTSGVGKLAYEVGQDVFGQIGTLRSEFEREMSEMIAHLIRLTLREVSDETALGSHKFMLCERIKSYIARNLRDPSLSIDRIAEVHKCTKRYLHKAFEEEGRSISEYIWQLRLDSCREQLLNSDARNKSITEIALSWGFNSSAHFSSAFKLRFGTSPSSLRKEAA
jgi:AraC-like DNA-binding protein